MRVFPHQALLDVGIGIDQPGLEDRDSRRPCELGNQAFRFSSKSTERSRTPLQVATARVTEVKKRLNWLERSGANMHGP